MGKPHVSIVIPAFNEERYIWETFDSLSHQSYDDFETIVVDSYSTDSTVDIAKDFGARVLYAPRGKIGLARNVGAKAARGDIIVHASADVRYDKDWLMNLIRPIDDGRAHVAFGSIYVHKGNIIENGFAHILNHAIVPFVTKVGMIYASGDNIASDAKFYHNIGGIREDLHTGEDVEFIKRAMRYGKVHFVKEAKAFTSPRRIRHWGYVRYFIFHFKNFLRTNKTGKGFDKYEPIREK